METSARTESKRPSVVRRLLPAVGAVTAVVVLLLVLPARAPDLDTEGQPTPFRWDADLLFTELEDEFRRAGTSDLQTATDAFEMLEAEGSRLLEDISAGQQPLYESLGSLANLQFRLVVHGAAHPSLLPRAEAYVVRTRVEVMKAAATWPLDRSTQEGLYRVLFGGRIALDEALIQAGTEALPSLRHIEDVPSATPSIVVEGVRIHSGDILLSRGGAPTSAMIARGTDFPNTFSHAAIAHVDADTGEGTVIESLIEAGSVLSSVEDYVEGKKHRILVLRLRSDHPALADDPLLPHHAAEAVSDRVRADHIPYDFAMDWQDPSEAFCSEIVYQPYLDLGVDLWAFRANVTSPGLVRWLGAMGVRVFTSLIPSDAEFDPQLRAVLEWRDAPALMDYRLDNAVIDALLEEAERGSDLGYAWYALPVARLLKGFSVAQAAFGGSPTIPAGMSAATALRVDALVTRIHPSLKSDLEARAAEFTASTGFQAPYWTLVELAREALAAQRDSLGPALTIR